jgi:hypothetical protein
MTLLAAVLTVLVALATWLFVVGWRIRYIAILIGWIVVAVAWLAVMGAAQARDLGQWEAADRAVVQWYQNLMQPDVPNASCCGEADAYWCDDVHVSDGHTFCRITDDRDDAPRGRPHRDLGQEFEIPPNKLKWDQSNPTGHAVIFLSRSGYVFCFVQGSGI